MGTSRRRGAGQGGSALLAVLWVSAALAAIAFSMSSTVRGETERTSTSLDGVRSEYLAAGGIWRATDELLWAVQNPNGPGLRRDAAVANFTFPSGVVRVDIVPEAAKLNVNMAPPEEIYRLLIALGQDPARARGIALAIAGARSPAGAGAPNLSATPSFSARHASFEEVEELLQVPGVTPDLFYGTYLPSPEESQGPRLTRRPGLEDCLSVFGSTDRIDANGAAPAVLAAIGLSPDLINALVERRRAAPLTQGQLSDFMRGGGVAGSRLRVGGNSIVTMKATGRLRLQHGQLSDLRRSVGAQVKFMPPGYDSAIHILRWYDTIWSN